MNEPWDRARLAARIAKDIPHGAVVNLGIGAPTGIADVIPDDREIVFHTENGMLGMGPAATARQLDPDLINAGKQPVTETDGAAYFHHADSFAMIRGGHIDICVLGAFQVSEHGDLANWSTGDADAVPAVGGAMDLAAGAERVYVMTDLFTRSGAPKIVATCRLPLTAPRCVHRVYTDHAIFDVTARGLRLRESLSGITVDELESLLGLTIVT